jgi:hypothetical protein
VAAPNFEVSANFFAWHHLAWRERGRARQAARACRRERLEVANFSETRSKELEMSRYVSGSVQNKIVQKDRAENNEKERG